MQEKSADTKQLYLESLVAALTGWNDPEARLAKAFERDEFLLFGQSIVPLAPGAGLPPHLEILIRLREEERNLTPPGAFIPILEYFEMMPALDRWVVEHAVRWWRARGGLANTVLSVNLSAATLAESAFAEFVGQQLRQNGMPGQALCFELAGTEVVVSPPELARSVEQLKSFGCTFAICSFGRDSISFDALKTVGAAFVKIDGEMIREIHRDAVAFAKVRSIHGVCRKARIHTVAEFVEQPETVKTLREIGVDYAQGYGMSRPGPLDEYRPGRANV